MRLSIIVIFHNMRREAARTLMSLSPSYQQGVTEADYEVIAIDNSSSAPLDAASVCAHGENFKYCFFETTSPSPVDAVNAGAEIARGSAVAVIVDGARMATPGLVANSLAALQAFPNAFVSSLSWHLGPDIQPTTIQNGYNQDVEDNLLDSIHWPEDGYRLFEIATLAPSSRPGFLGEVPQECSWFCLPRQVFQSIGGFDPQFQSPGGGMCNHEFRNRVVSEPSLKPVSLLGEGVFHQVHGGVATNAAPERRPHKSFLEEYATLFGKPYASAPAQPQHYFGMLPSHARKFLMPGPQKTEAP